MYKGVPKNYAFPPPEEPYRPMRPRPVNDFDRERVIRPRRYTEPVERVVRGGMRGSSRGSWSSRDSWRDYGPRGRNLRDEVGLRRGRGMRGEYYGIRGREIREWRYGELGWRERNMRDDFGHRGRGMNMRGIRNERIRGGRGRGIPRGPRGHSPHSPHSPRGRRDGRG